MATRKCAKGYITRAAYSHYTRKGVRTLVGAQCIRDVVPHVGGKSYDGPGIGPLKKGELAKYGYEKVTTLSVSERHNALDKAVADYGSLSTWRKLNAVFVYTKRTAPGVSAIFKEDMSYIRAKYGVKK